MVAPQSQDAPFQQSCSSGRSKGQDSNRLLSSRSKLRQALELQQKLYDTIMSGGTEIDNMSGMVRAWDVLEDRIRVLRGKVKPGTRNVSVREEMPKRQKVAILSSMAPYLPSAQPGEPAELTESAP